MDQMEKNDRAEMTGIVEVIDVGEAIAVQLLGIRENEINASMDEIDVLINKKHY